MDESPELVNRSVTSDVIAILLLLPGIVVVFFLLQLMSSKVDRILADMLPEGTPLPVVTRLAIGFPFMIVGAILALVVLVFSLKLRKQDWVQRHMALLVSGAWFGLGLFVLVVFAGLAMPLATGFTGMNY